MLACRPQAASAKEVSPAGNRESSKARCWASPNTFVSTSPSSAMLWSIDGWLMADSLICCYAAYARCKEPLTVGASQIYTRQSPRCALIGEIADLEQPAVGWLTERGLLYVGGAASEEGKHAGCLRPYRVLSPVRNQVLLAADDACAL